MAQPTIIAPETRIAGRIEGSEDVAVQGHVEGTIVLSEALFIAPTGFVRGDAAARVVHIEGAFVGELRAYERVVLGATARVQGNIITPLLEMAEGAQLSGDLTVGDVEEGAFAPVQRTATTRTTAPAPRRAGTPARPLAGSESAHKLEESRAATTTVTVEEEPQESRPLEELLADEAAQEVDEDYTVKELRDELRRRDLAVSGTKAELIERLLQAETEEQTT
ncbi:MAG: polymer-forming cytoskeletal protein [Bradymonadaceae bacterium]